jgi:hypothetical protein
MSKDLLLELSISGFPTSSEGPLSCVPFEPLSSEPFSSSLFFLSLESLLFSTSALFEIGEE